MGVCSLATTVAILMIRGKMWSPSLFLKGKREEQISHHADSVVKPFGELGGLGYAERLAEHFVGVCDACGTAFDLGAASNSRDRGESLGDTARGCTGSYDWGEDGGSAEAGWVFQSLLGCEAGEAVAGDRQV